MERRRPEQHSWSVTSSLGLELSGIWDARVAETDTLPVLHTPSVSVPHTKRFWGPKNTKGVLNVSRWGGWGLESRPREARLCWVVREV